MIRRGKEYNAGTLEYEGDYLYDRKWNGKGYDKNGNIIYELINGNGKVKEYNYDGELKFEGEYLNGKKNGQGKEYYKGRLEFEGEYLNGKRWNGKGKEYDYDHRLVYEGECLGGKRWNGKEKEYDSDSTLVFEVKYLNGKRWNGKGEEYI